MPVLKKKWIAANNEDNTDAGDSQEVDLVGEEDRELGEDGAATAGETMWCYDVECVILLEGFMNN